MAYTEKTVPSDCVNSGNMKSVPRIVIIHKSLQPWQAQCLFKTVNRQLIVYSIWLVMIHDWLIIPLQMQDQMHQMHQTQERWLGLRN